MSDALYADAALYDLMYEGFVQDVPLAVALAREANGPVLELCAGSGRLTLPMARAGADLDALDLSPVMLAALRERAAAAGLRVGTHTGDMADFDVPRRHALVLIGFNSFLHNLTQAAQLATLRGCRAHLEPGGMLALTMFHPSAGKLVELAAAETLSKDIANPHGPGRVRVFDACEDDRIEQVRRVTRRVEFTDDAGAIVRTVTTPFTIRWVYKPEMELLLAAAGFVRWTVQPLDTIDGAWTPVERTPHEGDMLLWKAWQD